MRFLVDAQLPPALARWLSANGHDATHVADHGMIGASDTAIWAFALSIDAAILTKDEDFAARRMRSADGPAIIWLRLPNMRRRQILRRVEAILPLVLSAIDNGETLIEAV